MVKSHDTPTPREATEELARLGAALAQVAGDQATQSRVVREIEALLTRLPVKGYEALVESPVIQEFVERMGARKSEERQEDPPGTIYNRGTLAQTKKPWTWRDFDNMPKRTWTPNRSVLLIFQGLAVAVQTDVEVTLPEVFYGIYQDQTIATRLGREHAEWLMRKRDSVSDPSILTPEGARARATGDTGWYRPGGGIIAGISPTGQETTPPEAPSDEVKS